MLIGTTPHDDEALRCSKPSSGPQQKEIVTVVHLDLDPPQNGEPNGNTILPLMLQPPRHLLRDRI